MPNILISGAASGIGLATAKLFSRQGWTVGLIDLDRHKLDQITESLGGPPHRSYAMDICDEAEVASAVAQFAHHQGDTIDVLFNCAGLLRTGPFEEISLAAHRQLINVNINGLINLTHMAFPFLKRSSIARVINMSSASALYGTPHFASYSASKFAVRGLTEALNIEWAPQGITVTDIMPPFVNTHMVASQQFVPPVMKKLGVKLEADDIAKAVWQAVSENRVHHPVGWEFRLAKWINKCLPDSATKMALRLLSKN
ncbi:MAG: SDR family oxidoreductase [Hahellaceae bacterium]|nr:SDR family oxidoreductase [Hahellaceae bacterium]MCP5169010.1 SDR family oxidoreductase [Hahellaceae bacterium]